MNILVTGGLGFIGSHFLKLMADTTDHNIVNIDKLTYAGNLKNVEDLPYETVIGDIANKELVNYVIRSNNIDTILHMAAETHVDRSIKNPRAFLETDILGLFNLIKVAKDNKVERTIITSCYDTNTRALTSEGFKYYEQIKKGDKVLTINPNTKLIEEKEVEKVIVCDYEGDMIHFNSQRVDINVTPNHRMYFEKANSRKLDENIYIEEAETFSKRSISKLPKCKWTGKKENTIYIKDIGNINTKDLFYISGIFIGDGFCSKSIKIIENKSGLKRKEFLKKCRDKKTGRFISTGKIGNETNTTSICNRIFIDIPESDECRNRVEETLTRLGINWHSENNKSGEHIYFSSNEWTAFFKQFGRYAKNKNIPNWMLQYDTEYLIYLFDGLIDSDGHRKRLQYTTISEKLVKDMCELGFKLGRQPIFRKNYSISYIDKRKIEGEAYYIYFPKSIPWLRNKDIITRKKYKGKVWCLKVKDNKNFIIERNGRLTFCGNTDEVYGPTHIPKSEDCILNPSSPYSASKAAGDMLAMSYYKTYGFPIIIIRPCNNYGTHQYPEKLIPMSITRLLEGKQILLHGNGSEIREWIHVKDCALYIKDILEMGEIGHIYNIGSGLRYNNLTVISNIINIMTGCRGCDVNDYITRIQNRPGNDYSYAVSMNKTSKLANNIYCTNMKDGLYNTIEWYKNNMNWWENVDIESNVYTDEYLR